MFLMGENMLRLLSAVAVLLASSPAFAQTLPDNEEARRALILSAREAQGFDKLGSLKEQRVNLDVYRTMLAAGVALTPKEAYAMGRAAQVHGQSIEVVEVWRPLVQRGVFVGASELTEAQARSVFERIVEDAEKDRNGGIQRDVETVDHGWPNENTRVLVAEVLIAMGEHELAINMLRTALARGKLEELDSASARLSLCRALIAAGRKDEARWELANFEPAPSGYGVLARVWLALVNENDPATSNPSSPAPP